MFNDDKSAPGHNLRKNLKKKQKNWDEIKNDDIQNSSFKNFLLAWLKKYVHFS